MEHVPEKSSSDSEPEMLDIAARIFCDRLPLALRYWSTLSTEGVERGLIGPREVSRLWSRHILNCAVVEEVISAGATVVDIGSGAGLPGIPLAIARPDLRILLVEPLLRRSVFLREFISASGMEITVVRGRAEQSEVIQEVGGADIVTSRAVASLRKVAEWSMPLLRHHGVMLALKGKRAAEELAEDQGVLRHAGAAHPQLLECGVGLLPQPTMVVSAERLPRPTHKNSKKSIAGASWKSHTRHIVE